MRKPSFWDGVYLMVGLALFDFVWGDEEPLLDWTDLSFLHVGLLAIAAIVVFAELTLRAGLGQSSSKDLQVGLASLVFWVNLETYFRLILTVCAAHNLLTLEAELLDPAEVLLIVGAWLTTALLPALGVVALLMGLGVFLQRGASLSFKVRILCLALICIGHLVVAVYLGGDLVVAGLTSWIEWERTEVFYLQPRSGWTYDRGLRTGDQFEWHRERSIPYSLRFEDLYLFVFQLLLLWDLGCSFVCWAWVLTSGLNNLTNNGSPTQLSLGLFWLNHLGVALGMLCLLLGGTGWRLSFRVPTLLGFE